MLNFVLDDRYQPRIGSKWDRYRVRDLRADGTVSLPEVTLEAWRACQVKDVFEAILLGLNSRYGRCRATNDGFRFANGAAESIIKVIPKIDFVLVGVRDDEVLVNGLGSLAPSSHDYTNSARPRSRGGISLVQLEVSLRTVAQVAVLVAGVKGDDGDR